MKLLDRYSLQARLLPVLITIAPLLLAVLSFMPNIDTAKAVVSVVATLGIVTLLSQVGRDLGKRKEPRLFEMWGGSPTTTLLSRSRSRLPRPVIDRYHRELSLLVTDATLPLSAAEEEQDPRRFADQYEACTIFLRDATRDKEKHELVFAENVSYGFRRNLWAMKPAGIASGVIGTFACGVAAYWALGHGGFGLVPVAGILVGAFLLVMWILRITPAWVRIPAEAYAERLLGALDTLTPTT